MQVKSSNGKTSYEVTSTSCTCGDYENRQKYINGRCKHMIEHFPQTIDGCYKKGLEFFRGGVNVEDALERFDEGIIKTWINTGHICKIFKSGKWKYLLLE